MVWRIEVAARVDKAIAKLDPPTRDRIVRFLYERLGRMEDPRSIGEALKGSGHGELWRYRVGDYRLICKIEDERLVVLVVRVGHRREIYRET